MNQIEDGKYMEEFHTVEVYTGDTKSLMMKGIKNSPMECEEDVSPDERFNGYHTLEDLVDYYGEGVYVVYERKWVSFSDGEVTDWGESEERRIWVCDSSGELMELC